MTSNTSRGEPVASHSELNMKDSRRTVANTKDDLFRSTFHRGLFDLMKQNKEPFKVFMQDVSGDDSLYATMMEKLLIKTTNLQEREVAATQSEDDDDDNYATMMEKLLVSTKTTNLQGLEAADTQSEDDDNYDSMDSSAEEEIGDEIDDEMTPLTPGVSRLGVFDLKKSPSRRESFARRSTIREDIKSRRDTFQEKNVKSSSFRTKLADETDHRTFLEEEIAELERLMDDQEDEIVQLDGVVEKYKKKNEGLLEELKTKRRTILIQEEKYSLLKSEFGMLRTRNEKLQLKVLEGEADRDLNIMSATFDRERLEEDLNNNLNGSLVDIQETLGKKDVALMSLMEEMDSLGQELKIVKKERDALEKTLDGTCAAGRHAEVSESGPGESSKEEMDSLRYELKTVKRQCDALEKTLDATSAAGRHAGESSKEEMDSLRYELKTVKQQCDDLEKTLDATVAAGRHADASESGPGESSNVARVDEEREKKTVSESGPGESSNVAQLDKEREKKTVSESGPGESSNVAQLDKKRKKKKKKIVSESGPGESSNVAQIDKERKKKTISESGPGESSNVTQVDKKRKKKKKKKVSEREENKYSE